MSIREAVQKHNGHYANGSAKKLEAKRREDIETRIKNRQNMLLQAASEEIPQIPPLIYYDETPIIRKWSINVIQGQSGVHKSRFAGRICSLFLSGDPNPGKRRFFGFRAISERPAVVYIDTERSLKAEFPRAIQDIAKDAGYGRDEIKTLYGDGDFIFHSIYDVTTTERLDELRFVLDAARKTLDKDRHMFVVIDVVTDCVKSFNDDKESSELLRYMRVLCERFDSTVLLVIHENPGSQKSRGHLGTESYNKAGTAIRVGFIRNADGEDTRAVELKFLKVRHHGKPLGLILEYDNADGLVSASKDTLEDVEAAKQGKAPLDQVREEIISFFGGRGQVRLSDLKEYLMDYFGAGKNTIDARLNTIIQTDLVIDGEGYRIKKERLQEQGSPIVFNLEPVNGKKEPSNDDDDIPL